MATTEEKQESIEQQSREIEPQRPKQNAGERNATANDAQALVADGFLVPSLEASGGENLPPAYGTQHGHVQFSQPGFDAGAEVTDDGRINVNFHTKNRRLADLLAPTINSQISASPDLPPGYIPPSLESEPGQSRPPALNVVVQIVGSRGDVQPFVALGKVLKDTYGHRIRVATHATFKSFVEENGLEFFNIGGDPAELMAFMVKNPGLMPGFDTLKSGEISRRRRGIEEILLGCWRSCVEAGDGLGPPPKSHRVNAPLDLSQGIPGDKSFKPFVADAIIANPPSFAHLHVAEKLGIPLHIMFTMPWSPTRTFPHPLANVQFSNADDVMTNYMTYTLVEMMTWQGLGDIINRFREKVLDLPPLSFIGAPGVLNRLKVPHTYCWSPVLIPKPNDWGQHIDVSGFYFLNLASSYVPDSDLAAFLEVGPSPVYIGFGSVVVDDPNTMTRMIFEAIRIAGIRALVSKGWGGLGADDIGIPEGVFMLGNVPHDWLFERVSAVVHHGGAGTTAAGIKAGKPTFVVPFFGDQEFWGSMVARAQAGPEPIRYKQLTAKRLAEAIRSCLQSTTQARATDLGNKIRGEKGTDMGARSFHRHMNIEFMRCSLAPSRVATWRVKKTNVRLSPLAMSVLVDAGLIEYKHVKLCRHIEYNTEEQPLDPITAGAASLIGDLSGIGLAVADIPRGLFQTNRSKYTQDSKTGPMTVTPKMSTYTNIDVMSDTVSPNTDVSNIDVIGADTLVTTSADSRYLLADIPHKISASQNSMLIDPAPASSPGRDSSAVKSRTQSTTQSRMRSSTDETRLVGAGSRRESSPRGFDFEATVVAGQSVGRVVTTGVKTPMNLCLGLAKGFRNIPRLYNDDTIRPIEKVTDLSSGMKVAGKELGFGFFDGIVGLVTQPMRGADKEGAGGFVKGIGKGIGGLIVKPAAGIWGLPAYMMQGVYAEVNKMFSKSVTNYMITSRIVQGNQDRAGAREAEKTDIVLRWTNMKVDLENPHMLERNKKEAKKTRVPGADTSSSTTTSSVPGAGRSWRSDTNLSSGAEPRLSVQNQETEIVHSPIPIAARHGSGATQNLAGDAIYEEAIRASVRETSRGSQEEDALVEAAIRASVKEARAQYAMQCPPYEGSEQPRKDSSIFDDREYQLTDQEYQDLIEHAIQQSLASHTADLARRRDSGISAAETSASAAQVRHGSSERSVRDDDADVQTAIEDSKNTPRLPHEEFDEASLQQALEASKREMDRHQSQINEEEIVLEYVKKQSLAEEEYRKNMEKSKGILGPSGHDDDDDEELEQALEESLKLYTGDEAGPFAKGSNRR
ncbi:hypothetical protein E4U21_007128 [Claviceps maximensis]|nr:hypothetical protein E4U21_007128 [Claviceps maximensis]